MVGLYNFRGAPNSKIKASRQRVLLYVVPLLIFGCSKPKSEEKHDATTTTYTPPADPPLDMITHPAAMLTLPTLNFEYFADPYNRGHGRYLAASKCNEVVVEATDEIGWPPLPLTSVKVLGLKTSSPSGAFYSDKECSHTVTTTNIGPESLKSTVFYKDALIGELTLTVNDNSEKALYAAASTITMTATAGLVFASPALHQKPTDCGRFVVEAQNASGAAQIQTSPLSLNLLSNSTTGVFYSDSACTKPLASMPVPRNVALLVQTDELFYSTTIEAGSAHSVDIYYKDAKAGARELSATEYPRQKLTQAKISLTIID